MTCKQWKTEKSKWLLLADYWLLPCQFGSDYFRTQATHIGSCINMSLSLLWCHIISVSVFFSLWSPCCDVNTHSCVKTHATNHICKVFNFRVCRVCDSENKSSPRLPPVSLSTSLASVCVWQGAGPLSPGWSVHLLVISYEAAIKPHTSVGFWTLSQTTLAVWVIYFVNFFCTVNSFSIFCAWIAFARNATMIPPRQCCSGPSLSQFHLDHTTLVICPSCSLMPLPLKLIHLKPALVLLSNVNSIQNIPGGAIILPQITKGHL